MSHPLRPTSDKAIICKLCRARKPAPLLAFLLSTWRRSEIPHRLRQNRAKAGVQMGRAAGNRTRIDGKVGRAAWRRELRAVPGHHGKSSGPCTATVRALVLIAKAYFHFLGGAAPGWASNGAELRAAGGQNLAASKTCGWASGGVGLRAAGEKQKPSKTCRSAFNDVEAWSKSGE